MITELNRIHAEKVLSEFEEEIQKDILTWASKSRNLNMTEKDMSVDLVKDFWNERLN